MHRTTRLILVAIVGAILVGALVWVALRPVPVSAELVEVTRGPMAVTVEVDGTTRIREVWEVAAPIAGTALRSPVRVGDPVAKGETVVAIVEPVIPSLLDARARSQAEAAVHEAEAALSVAQSRVAQADEDLAYARSQLVRAKALVERGVASLVRLEDAAQALKVSEASRDTAVAAHAMAIGALERAKAALIGPEDSKSDPDACCVQIRAPADGVVLAIDQISERPVASGERLLSVGDPSNLEIVADPLSQDAVRIPPAAPADVARWGGEGVLSARLRTIEPSAYTVVSALGIEEQRVEAIFDFVGPVEARPGLGDGYAVRLEIEIWSASDVLRVPVGALFRQDGAWAVFVVRGGRAVITEVDLGRRNDRVAEVRGGLFDGDVVVTHPGNSVREGVKVEAAVRE